MLAGGCLMHDLDLLEELPTPALVGVDYDVTRHDLAVLTDPHYPPSEKETAAQWIAYCWFRNPIDRQRWYDIGLDITRELCERADANDTTPQAELKACVVQALSAAEAQEPVDLISPEPRKVFIRRLNERVVENLLGQDWRDRTTTDVTGLESVLADLAGCLGDEEASLDLENIIARSRLEETEALIVRAICDGDQEEEIAAELGMTPAAVHAALSLARQKMKEAVYAI